MANTPKHSESNNPKALTIARVGKKGAIIEKVEDKTEVNNSDP